MSEWSRGVQLRHLAGAIEEAREDHVAHEEPLEIQLDGHSFAVLMRTPGHDEELGLGFLLTEGLIESPADVASMRHCSIVPTAEAEDNVLQVRLHRPVDVARFRRNLFASSSCGVCGKATIDNAMRSARVLDSTFSISREVLRALPRRLSAQQPAFAVTGGLHAAALFEASGVALVTREDVGRHNAVDKVIGWASGKDVSMHHLALLVSGRLSFELVQKAVAARIPVLAGISAPTSLAVRMAEALGLTLIGFLREDSMNVYSHERRVS